MLGHLISIANKIGKRHGMRLEKCVYDPLKCPNGRPKELIMAQLVAQRGTINHSVAFAGDLIFDCARERALPTTRQSLDVICEGLGYKRLKKIYMLVKCP